MQGLEITEPSHAGALAAGEDQMIEQAATQRLGDGREALRRTEVRIARPRVAARMIVREENGRAPLVRGIDDDLTEREIDAASVAKVA